MMVHFMMIVIMIVSNFMMTAMMSMMIIELINDDSGYVEIPNLVVLNLTHPSLPTLPYLLNLALVSQPKVTEHRE